MPTWPTPPPDGSGGYAEILVSDSVDSHVIRIHLAEFGSSSPYTYTGGSHGGEATVSDTIQAFMDIVKVGYDNSWALICTSLVRVSGGVLTTMFPVPTSAATGSNGLAAVAATDPARATVNTFTMRTLNPSGRTKYVLRLPSWGNHYTNASSPTHTTGDLPQAAILVQANSSGTESEKIVAYVTGTNGLVAHDGFKPSGAAKLSVAENKRLRRRYGFA